MAAASQYLFDTVNRKLEHMTCGRLPSKLAQQLKNLYGSDGYDSAIEAGFISACEILLPMLAECISALEFYADKNSWSYTSYDNFHEMHDDAQTVKVNSGNSIDCSGAKAAEQLTKLQAYLKGEK